MRWPRNILHPLSQHYWPNQQTGKQQIIRSSLWGFLTRKRWTRRRFIKRRSPISTAKGCSSATAISTACCTSVTDAEGKPVVVDWTGCRFREIKEHNLTVPVVPVFPGDQVTCFSPEAEKELFRHTIRQTRHRGYNSTIMMSVAKARFSMPEACDDLRNYYKPLAQPNGFFFVPDCGYYLVESVGIAAAISEFLLQSVDNTLRVFPCWPKNKDASFTNLRAQGGFLVSAEQKAGQIVKLEITATVGGKLRILNPWTGNHDERDLAAGKTLRMNP